MEDHGEILKRLSTIERWIAAHEAWCKGHFDMTNDGMRRNDRDHSDIKIELKELRGKMSNVNLYIGGAIVIASILGSLFAEILAKHL